MRKAIAIVLSEKEHPAPFESAKRIALQVSPNQNGDYVWSAECVENGTQIIYQIILNRVQSTDGRNHDIVIIAKIYVGIGYLAIGNCSICNDFKYMTHQMSSFEDADREKVLEAAWEIFRQLVEKKFI